MKQWIGLTVALVLMLSGCARQTEYETVTDVWQEQEMPAPRVISVDLPGEAALPAMESDSGRAYLCNDYEIYIQTMPAGDVGATVEAMSGFAKDKLTIVQTQQEDGDRYEFVWASTGEQGDYLGRGVILDDGNYHYTMAVLRNTQTTQASSVVWDGVFSSFCIS